MADSIVTADRPMLPRDAVDTVLQHIVMDLQSARRLLKNAADSTPEGEGALALIEKVGALAEEAIHAYGGLGVATAEEWTFGDKSVDALDALKTCLR